VHGILTVFGADGHIIERGPFDGFQKQGVWEYNHPSQGLSLRGLYVDGAAEGLWVSYHPNGSLAGHAMMSRGRFHGPRVAWLPDGSLDRANSGEYAHGVMVPDLPLPTFVR
jgi:antitoxin component YwqK of YwqJK toxin-antitoxin module